MSSPARAIRILCRSCGETFTTFTYRPAINVTLEDWTPEEIRTATTATCPDCGLEVQLTALLVDGGKFRVLNRAKT